MSIEQFFSFITSRTGYNSIRWWCPLCTRPTRLVGLFIVLTHWNNSVRIYLLLHYSSTISGFRANQSMTWFLYTACLE